MARLEAISKGLYYPTPIRVIDMIAETAKVTHQGEASLLDPCAGEGEAAARLANHWGLQSYGVELHHDRAKVAASHMGACLQGSYHQIDKEQYDEFSVLFLNPPYDWSSEEDGSSARQEVQFLNDNTKFLAHNGLLVYIPPIGILEREDFRNLIRRHYRNVDVWRFPDPEYDSFGQVVVLAQRYVGHYGYYGDLHQVESGNYPALGSSHYLQNNIHLTSEGNKLIDVPSASPSKFKLTGINPEEIKPSHDLEGPTGAYSSPKWLALTGDGTVNDGMPLVAPRPGHQAMLLAAGRLNGVEMDGHLLKGGSEKTKTTIETRDKVIERERIVSHLSTLNLTTGDTETWNVNEEQDRTAGWFNRNGEALRRAILESHTPVFDGDLSTYDFGKVVAPGILPGRSRPEFLQVQKEAAAATSHRWKDNKSVVISGEMGVGKTSVAIMASELSGHDKTVVVCPSHLVPKWIRECEKILRRKGIAVTAKRVSDVDSFFTAQEEEGWFDLTGDSHQVEPKFLVLSKEMAKLGARWKPEFSTRSMMVEREIYKHDKYGMGVRTVERTKRVFVSCPRCGKVVVEGGEYLTPKHIDSKIKRSCSECGEALWSSKPISSKGTKRWPLAKYISHRYARRFALIVDEVHQHANPDSDQSRAVQMLASSSTKILAMTGTLYGGRASSIFHLLYKVDHRFREVYNYNERKKFVEHHGLFEHIYDQEERTSTYGYRRGRSGGRLREIPGMSPEMIPLLLPYTIFIKLSDLNVSLPPYSEDVVLVRHDPDVEKEVGNFASHVLNVLRKNPKLLGQYLMACLGYPDRPDQEEQVTLEDNDGEGQSFEIVARARPFPDRLWPKDEKVIEICSSERSKGRKVLIFFSQTHRRDARPRIKSALEASGFRVTVLDSNISPEKREDWLAKEERSGFDVMLTNGKLVETGMDLLFAHTIIQYGIEYSIHTLRQSVRRSWRLGQTKPVRVFYLGYSNTMQGTAIDLIARKMRAAEMIDGDDAGGLAQYDEGGSNFLVELAHEVLRRSTEQQSEVLPN